MKIISIRKNPEYKEKAIRYFQDSWESVSPIIYSDCIEHSIDAKTSLPQWHLLEKDHEIIGGAGLITNDFISRMDLYPWLCALHINDDQRGNNFGSLLIDRVKSGAKKAGFDYLYLSTDLKNYYEKYGFEHIGIGYHPWGEESKIYQLQLI